MIDLPALHAAAACMILRDRMVVRPDRHALRAPAELAAQRLQSLHDAVVEAAHSGAQRSLRQRHFTMAQHRSNTME